jgi:hypothetical protein
MVHTTLLPCRVYTGTCDHLLHWYPTSSTTLSTLHKYPSLRCSIGRVGRLVWCWVHHCIGHSRRQGLLGVTFGSTIAIGPDCVAQATRLSSGLGLWLKHTSCRHGAATAHYSCTV